MHPTAETLDQLPYADLIDTLGLLAEQTEDPDLPARVRAQALLAYNEVCDEIDCRAHLN